MLVLILKHLFFFLIYTPKRCRTCNNGWHVFNKWVITKDGYGQVRACKKCGYIEADKF